jgi:hypothetical protein
MVRNMSTPSYKILYVQTRDTDIPERLYARTRLLDADAVLSF